jgi:3-carboxy-cis,cis-muconate cycloisomerase
MTFSALDSALTGPLFATQEMRAVFSDAARIAAMLRVEGGLARAEAQAGLVPKKLAREIERISVGDFDLAEIGARTADAGVPSIPFLKALEAKLPAGAARGLHFGATSQDLMDTALVLQMGAALDLVMTDLAAVLAGLARLAKGHRKTPCIGRSYGQHAAPITFGATVAGWLTGLNAQARSLPEIRERTLVASLGGPVGTLAGLGDKAEAVTAAFAANLGLRAPPVTWHTARGNLAAVGAWLALLTGALAKMATDVVFLSATEVDEVAEAPAEGRGGSSAMPHKRNPVSSTVIIAAHAAASGHVVTLLNAMPAGQQRPAGAWHAEWHALPALFGLASGALREARRIAEGLVVDAKKMRANIDLTGGLIFADAAATALAARLGRAEAHAAVKQAIARAGATGTTFRSALAESADGATIAAIFDLAPAVNAGAATADRAIDEANAARRALKPRKEA